MDIILHGCNGAMGLVLTRMIAELDDARVVAGIDIDPSARFDYPVFQSLSDCDVPADVLIDFSVAKAMDSLLPALKERKIPAVVCTTGLSEEQTAQLKEVAKTSPVLRSANMSLGINTLVKVLTSIAPLLYEAGYDIEIVEKHHNHKVDAPSGTALALADAINESLGGVLDYKLDRSAQRKAREHSELGIQAVRGGTIVGDHDVIFAGTDEVITVSHQAYSRRIFATGAITAARFLCGKPAGLYTMADVVG